MPDEQDSELTVGTLLRLLREEKVEPEPLVMFETPVG